MIVKFKRVHPDAVLPHYAHPDGEDNGLDLVAASITETDDYIEYDTGIAVEIPKGYCGLLVPNSRCSKKDLVMCNAPGIIDPGYRGTMRARYKKVWHLPTLLRKFLQSVCALISNAFGEVAGLRAQEVKFEVKHFEVGEVVAQLVIIPAPQIEVEETDTLTPSMRDTAGFGSTVKKQSAAEFCPECQAVLFTMKDLDDTFLYTCTNCGYWRRVDNDGKIVAGSERVQNAEK